MQTMEIERYVEMVRQVGVEEAYNQRFRCTGRTVRDILALATKMSEGKKVHIAVRNVPGKHLGTVQEVMYLVCCVCEQLGMHVDKRSRNTYYFPQSGGRIADITENMITGGKDWERYELHDS